jgi:Fe-S-cluster containining protein
VKLLARGALAFDLAVEHASRRARGERPYLLAGDCHRCARCCEAPAVQVLGLVFHSRGLRRLFLWWQEAVNGFVLSEARPGTRTFVFRCTHFDPETRACDSYASRPGICRDYPRLQLWQTGPEFLPGCGYRALAPGAARLRVLLDAEPMTAEQRARLDRGLHLEE